LATSAAFFGMTVCQLTVMLKVVFWSIRITY